MFAGEVYPYRIAGADNIMIGPVHIGVNATLYATRAKIIIKQHFFAGSGFAAIAGDYMPILVRFIDTVNEAD